MNRLKLANVRLVCWTLGLLALIALWGQWTSDLRAQAAEPEVAAEAVEPAEEAKAADPKADESAAKNETIEAEESLGKIIFTSSKFGLIFYIILAIFSLVALTVIMERLVNLQRNKVLPPEFVARLQEMISRKDDSLEKLRQLADSSATPIARILKAGTFRAGRPLPEVEKAMEDATAREMAAMRSRVRPLGVVGSVAPLVGLLGTVVGMIFAFMVSSQEGLGKAELLAEGIYLALMTTAAGLTIAIPCLLCVAWFNACAERFMRDIDEELIETMPSFARMENGTNGAVGAEAETVASTV